MASHRRAQKFLLCQLHRRGFFKRIIGQQALGPVILLFQLSEAFGVFALGQQSLCLLALANILIQGTAPSFACLGHTSYSFHADGRKCESQDNSHLTDGGTPLHPLSGTLV